MRKAKLHERKARNEKRKKRGGIKKTYTKSVGKEKAIKKRETIKRTFSKY